MKKMLILLLGLMMLFSAALAEEPLPEELLIPGQERVTLAEAVGMAYGLIDALPAEHMSRANLVRLTDNTHAWVVSVYGQRETQPVQWTFTFSADDGEVLWQETAAETFQQTLRRWEKAKGEQKHWTHEQFRLYERLYVGQGNHALTQNIAIGQEEACDIALAALGLTDDRAYQMACSLTGDIWQVILVQDGLAVWQMSIDTAAGQVLLTQAVGGNG